MKRYLVIDTDMERIAAASDSLHDALSWRDEHMGEAPSLVWDRLGDGPTPESINRAINAPEAGGAKA